MPDLTAQELTDSLIEKWHGSASNLLQILIEVQQTQHHIPNETIGYIADKFSMPASQIKGVIGFYSFLHLEPQGEYEILISDNIIDQMQGSRQAAIHLTEQLGNQATKVSIDVTACTGMSDQGPAALINGHTVTRLTSERIDQVTKLVKAKKPLEEWPKSLFEVKPNIQRKDILLSGELIAGQGISKALEQGTDRMLDSLADSGLRGCGGAGFKTAAKWRFCADTENSARVVVCNADEGEPGTFKDRLLLQQYADRLFEGMTVCAATIGASQGFLYLRGEYRFMLEALEQELERRRQQNLLGKNILGNSSFEFDISIHMGAGAYVCGEESALIESLEGKRGIPRIRPPFPVTSGYLGRPTVVNNVETFCLAAMIAAHGASWFNSTGTEQSPGTKLISISGDCQRPGIYEYPFGVSVQAMLDACGASNVQAVQVGGPSGQLISPDQFNRLIAFEDLATGGSFMIFNQERDLLAVINNFSGFFMHESCGFCTPCRVGTALLNKQLGKIMVGHATSKDLDNMKTIGSLMKETSHCGLGQTASNPLLDSMKNFPLIYKSKLRSTGFEPAFDLDASLEEARQATGRNDAGAHLKGGGV